MVLTVRRRASSEALAFSRTRASDLGPFHRSIFSKSALLSVCQCVTYRECDASVAVWLDGAVLLSPLTKKANKRMTHKQMVKKMLKNPAVKAEVDKLNREEFAILDEILAARKQAGLFQTQIAREKITATAFQ